MIATQKKDLEQTNSLSQKIQPVVAVLYVGKAPSARRGRQRLRRLLDHDRRNHLKATEQYFVRVFNTREQT